MAVIIQGKQIARELCDRIAREAEAFRLAHDLPPALAVVLVGDHPASEVYVRQKVIECGKAGIRSEEYRLPGSTPQAELLELIGRLNRDDKVHGILVQLPLPDPIDAVRVLDAIAPDKDVDGFHPVNVGRLSTGSDGLVPCTPLGCMMLLDTVIDELRGRHAVVIGKSNIVGKPVALMLLERECTVTVTHIATQGLSEIVRGADIVVAAAGAPRLVRGDWIKPGAVVIDVGITRQQGPDGRTRLVGDCAADEMDHAAAVTPVPGGVGPMTIACLLSNTLKAARRLAHG
ncbi:bifunctional methylenetetrahydrofolate dehydrogenase/methenyltetrahydrofolate cyclohydrolase FolD [Caballeronia sp. LZ034LL]|uniref:bifunctional 5,10-methylenetetrahydrofolate dehydrogenase/5,10-methenyltetrahydrofolate cyclohydrolase n=1 Tax=Caballeronia sp. LZ034LL TaxID=3038567 RepID=UPI002862B700|nr:bifunctional methylenetetrahydrofolate dehydrogenase/methenyltetrahydrofolate cyclohydrolase FolD [Caballeronia sp. LZ034LL]MDR5839033.1 bifunctional methylenetetrahydrofolate dehydrogenase/methenyltetrahydrofolate cyclohydrolase FolD [Caballeronia sp. LZ034LL]